MCKTYKVLLFLCLGVHKYMIRKKEGCGFISKIYVFITVVMVLRERRWAYSDLEFMYMKLVKLEHHHENFFRAISDDIVPYGLRLKKSPQISSTSDEFKEKGNALLGEAERALASCFMRHDD